MGVARDGSTLPRWASGVVLEDAGARALVRADPTEREVSVVALGPAADRVALAAVIQSHFTRIHSEIAGLGAVEELELATHRETWVPVATLRADERRGSTSYAPTPAGSVEISNTRELDRLSSAWARDPHGWRARVFVSYSRHDIRQKEELLMRLKPLEVRDGLVSVWQDRCLEPGEAWDARIREELERADVIILLVSARFLATDYVREIELTRADARAAAGEALLVPVILERCGWEHERFARFNALPAKAEAIRDTRPQRNAWEAVARSLRGRVLSMREVRVGTGR